MILGFFALRIYREYESYKKEVNKCIKNIDDFLLTSSDEMNAILLEKEPICDKHSCRWKFSTFIPSGTPIFRTSGYVGIFDFGLRLAKMTSEELQEQPGYGFSITPWRISSGNAVCPIEYFPEPLKSEYMELLNSYK